MPNISRDTTDKISVDVNFVKKLAKTDKIAKRFKVPHTFWSEKYREYLQKKADGKVITPRAFYNIYKNTEFKEIQYAAFTKGMQRAKKAMGVDNKKNKKHDYKSNIRDQLAVLGAEKLGPITNEFTKHVNAAVKKEEEWTENSREIIEQVTDNIVDQTNLDKLTVMADVVQTATGLFKSPKIMQGMMLIENELNRRLGDNEHISGMSMKDLSEAMKILRTQAGMPANFKTSDIVLLEDRNAKKVKDASGPAMTVVLSEDQFKVSNKEND